MEFFDIIIIGAGPAGLRCAEFLGNSKYKVLIVEKNSKIGPKICAGGLTNKDIEVLNLPSNILDASYKNLYVQVNNVNSKLTASKNLAHTIDREKLGQWQVKRLEKYNNIEIKTNSRVTKIEAKHISVNNQETYSYNYLIGADGATSIVRKYLNLDTEKVNLGVRFLSKDKYNQFLLSFNSGLFGARYAWMFPHENHTNIGASFPRYSNQKNLKSHFKQWLEKKGIDYSEDKFEFFPINFDYRGYKFNNIFLIGGAAGFTFDFTGEGIYPALISGEEVARLILNPEYKPKKLNQILRHKYQQRKLLQFLNHCGIGKTVIFYMGQFLLHIPYFKKKALNKLS